MIRLKNILTEAGALETARLKKYSDAIEHADKAHDKLKHDISGLIDRAVGCLTPAGTSTTGAERYRTQGLRKMHSAQDAVRDAVKSIEAAIRELKEGAKKAAKAEREARK